MSDKVKQERLIFIDALRGIAALTVLFYHARMLFWIGITESFQTFGITADPSAILGYLTLPFKFGSLGVQLFFVMSGYCIHRNHSKHLANDPTFNANWKNYSIRRLFRIYPTYIAALLATALFDLVVLPYLGVQGFYEGTIVDLGDNSLRTFFMNLLGLQNIFSPTYGTNGALWTLSIEIHFYIAYPILFLVGKKYGATKMLGVSFLATCLYLCMNPFFENSMLLKILLFTKYWFIWCLGAYIADLEYGRAKPFIVQNYQLLLMCILCPVVFYFSKEVGEIAFSVLFFLFIYKKISDPSTASRGASILAKIGVFSYSLYVIHLPLLCVLLALRGGSQSPLIYTSFLATLVSIVGGYLFFLMVEKWTLQPFWRR